MTPKAVRYVVPRTPHRLRGHRLIPVDAQDGVFENLIAKGGVSCSKHTEEGWQCICLPGGWYLSPTNKYYSVEGYALPNEHAVIFDAKHRARYRLDYLVDGTPSIRFAPRYSYRPDVVLKQTFDNPLMSDFLTGCALDGVTVLWRTDTREFWYADFGLMDSYEREQVEAWLADNPDIGPNWREIDSSTYDD